MGLERVCNGPCGKSLPLGYDHFSKEGSRFRRTCRACDRLKQLRNRIVVPPPSYAKEFTRGSIWRFEKEGREIEAVALCVIRHVVHMMREKKRFTVRISTLRNRGQLVGYTDWAARPDQEVARAS
jgi:hypothetical protein